MTNNSNHSGRLLSAKNLALNKKLLARKRMMKQVKLSPEAAKLIAGAIRSMLHAG